MDENVVPSVFVFAEQVDNHITPVSFELIAKARELAEKLECEVVALLLGEKVEELVQPLFSYGANKVILCEDPALAQYRTEPYTHAISK